MSQKQDFIGIKSPIPSIAPEINGTPASVPGGNDGKDKTTMVVEQSPSANNTSSDDDQIKADAVAGIDDQISTLSDIIEQIGYKPDSKEDKEKRERREKSKRIIAAVSDGISALSNLYYTTQYAPNMYNHDRVSQTGAVYAGIERAKAEREKQRDQHLRFALKLGDLNTQRAATLRELEEQHERQKLAREQAQRQAELHPIALAIKREQQKKAEQEALAAEQEAIHAKDYWQSRINKNNYRRPIVSGSHGKRPEYPWYDRNRKLHYASSYEAMRQNSINNGTWSEATQQSVTERELKDRRGMPKNSSTSTTIKPAKGHSERPQEKKKTNVNWK